MKGKVSFEEDILQIHFRNVSYYKLGFKIYKMTPPIISVPKRYLGFDLYISGEFTRELSIIACYAKLDNDKYELVKIYDLGGKQHCPLETEMTVRFFERQYLIKKCGFEIISKR